MKKILLVALLILALLVTMMPAFAAEENPVNTGVKTDFPVKTNADLESPGILPTNPFYFIKQWGRGLRRAFTFNAVSRTAFEMDVADQKLAELQKLSNIKLNEEAIKGALSNYDYSLGRLSESLAVLDGYENANESDKVFTSLVSLVKRHQLILISLSNRYDELSYYFNASEETLVDLLRAVPAKAHSK